MRKLILREQQDLAQGLNLFLLARVTFLFSPWESWKRAAEEREPELRPAYPIFTRDTDADFGLRDETGASAEHSFIRQTLPGSSSVAQPV